MAETAEPPHTNGISAAPEELLLLDETDDKGRMRPADIDADVREMERRKRVESIMNSKLFREELERIIELQLKDGSGTSSLMQQISDMMGGVSKSGGNASFKSNSNCVVPINDIRGIESMGYAKGEKILRCKLAAVYRLIDLYGWTQGACTLITARLNQDEEHFLVNPYGMLFHEMTASSLIKADMQGAVVEQGTTNFGVNLNAYSLHAAIHSARPDIKCIIHVHTPSVVAVSALKCGLLPISQEAVVIGDVSTHAYVGAVSDTDEKEKIARNLGPNNKVLLLSNQGAVCCGETIEEAFYNARNTVLASESQLKLMPVGIDNLMLLSDEARKKIYDAAHKAPESSPRPDQPSVLETKVERKWRIGGVEFEALMRMLDNAGFRTGYIYRHPLVKGEPPRPRNDVEVPPAVSSLGYLLSEEELYKQGLWKKMEGGRKGFDRTRWLNSPNVYQKVEILETGTPDPKKITKWVADGSPTHSSTPVKIESALQFVPKNTNPKEFKKLQQQIKDYRRADKISAGPQSQILEGVTWEEARKMQDAGVTQTGDQVVLMGAASKGIIQRGFQHNATMYKAPYSKNPFDSITDEEIDEYKRVVERKTKGEYDTDYSESEGLSSAQINKRISDMRSPTSETEEESRDEPQVLRIETKHAPKPSQPEVVLSDAPVVRTGEDETYYDEVFLPDQGFTNIDLNQSPGVNITSPPYDSKRSTVTSMRKDIGGRKKSAVTSQYRTTTHFGFPKGSYALPNPMHFHYARKKQPIALAIQCGKQKNGEDDRGLPQSQSTRNVGVNLIVDAGGERASTIEVDISVRTLRDFIYPFAHALNLIKTDTTGSQTSYLQAGFAPSPLPSPVNAGAVFERSIVQKLHANLLSDMEHTTSGGSEYDTMFLGVDDVHCGMGSSINSSATEEPNDASKFNFSDLDVSGLVSGIVRGIVEGFASPDVEARRRSSLSTICSFNNECEHSPNGSLNEELERECSKLDELFLNRIPDSLNFYQHNRTLRGKGGESLAVPCVNEIQTSDAANSSSGNLSNQWSSLNTFEGKVNAIQSIARMPISEVVPKKPASEEEASSSLDAPKKSAETIDSENAYSMFMVSNLVDLIRAESDVGANDPVDIENTKRRIHLQSSPHYYCPSQDARLLPTIHSNEVFFNACKTQPDELGADATNSIDLMKHLAENSSDEVDECMSLFFHCGEDANDTVVAPHNSLTKLTGEQSPSPTSSGVTDDTAIYDKMYEAIKIVEAEEEIGVSEDSGCDESEPTQGGGAAAVAAQRMDSSGSYHTAQATFNDERVEIVEQMSDLILDYMCKSCIQTDRVVVFPEVKHDENIRALFKKLDNLFTEYFKHSLTAEGVSELRIDLGVRVIRKTKVHYELEMDVDKMYAVTEFVSDLLDYFFEANGVFPSPNHSNYEEFQDCVLNSTPEPEPNQEDEASAEELAMFKLKQLHSGNEYYWLSALKPSERNLAVTSPSRPVVNVDDIPLIPPHEQALNRTIVYDRHTLSPIMEATPRKSIFCEGYEHEDDNRRDLIVEEVPPVFETISAMSLRPSESTPSVSINFDDLVNEFDEVIDALGEEELYEAAQDGEEEDPLVLQDHHSGDAGVIEEMAFEEGREIRNTSNEENEDGDEEDEGAFGGGGGAGHRFISEVQFMRAASAASLTDAFIRSSSVSFSKEPLLDDDDNDELQEDDGDWMGYELAKF